MCSTASLALSDVEREHLYLLGRGHTPEVVRAHVDARDVPPQLQRVLDAIAAPALIATSTWDIVAWNAVATEVCADYAAIPPEKRNTSAGKER